MTANWSTPRGPLREAHAHLAQLGRSLSMLDLASCRSRDHMIEELATFSQSVLPGQWVLAHGARPDAWPDPTWPTRRELDTHVPDHPVCAWCFDYHAMVVNTPALESAAPPSSVHHLIERNADGVETGLMLEQAATWMWSVVPDATETERREQLILALRHLSDLGFTEVHDLKSQRWLGGLLSSLKPEERRLNVHLYPLLEELESVLASRSKWESDSVQLAGAKVFVDGTLNSRTAWMLEPFRDGRSEHSCGIAMMTTDEIESAVRFVDARGLPLACHAIGDAAVRAVLDAVEQGRPKTPGFRIEHAELIDSEDVPRFAHLGVIASVQPVHLLSDIEALQRSLPDRTHRVLPLRDLIDAGCSPGELLLFGSDVPIVPADPTQGIQAAVVRGRAGEATRIAPDQSITESEAWQAFA